MPRTTWGPLSTDEQNAIEFAPVGEPGVLVAGTAGGLLKRNADGTMGNSILSESGSVLTAAGSLRFSLTTQAGLRFNNLTTTQRNALTGAAGDAVWNTTTTRLNVHNGSAWTDGFVRLAGDTMTGPLVIGGGTVTASTPVLDLSQTWNLAGTTFTGLKFNVTDSASASASLLFDWQVGGVSKASVRKDGLIKAAFLESSGVYFGTLADTILVRGAANTLDLRNLANAQTFNVYGTTDAGVLNYRRIRTTMTTGGAVTIAAEGLGTGVSGNSLAFTVNGTQRLSIDSTGDISISAPVLVGDTRNFVLSGTTGSKIGTATTQKLGFWNATPVVQPSSTGETVGFTAGAGTPVTDASTFTGNVGATAYRISDIVKALKNSGLMAS